MLVLALADPEAKGIAQQVSRMRMIELLGDWLGAPHAQERTMYRFALLAGFVIQVDRLHPRPMPEHSLQWLAKAWQTIADG